ncbi:MAG: hypothetical protein KBC11_00905 [Candidatus Pacebacteria bacterium]|nr:hypothetical protein [Candidatus Paceibacterota bacterium]
MVAKKTTKKSSNVGKVVAIGAGVAALSVAAYMLFGPNGKKNQKSLKGWAIKMKGEIIEKLETVKDVTAPVYEKIVSEVAAKYAKLKHIDAADLEAEVATLKKHWKALIKNTSKKTVKKVSKKVSKK